MYISLNWGSREKYEAVDGIVRACLTPWKGNGSLDSANEVWSCLGASVDSVLRVRRPRWKLGGCHAARGHCARRSWPWHRSCRRPFVNVDMMAGSEGAPSKWRIGPRGSLTAGPENLHENRMCNGLIRPITWRTLPHVLNTSHLPLTARSTSHKYLVVARAVTLARGMQFDTLLPPSKNFPLLNLTFSSSSSSSSSTCSQLQAQQASKMAFGTLFTREVHLLGS
jgi:hypothetical protein